MHRGPGFGFGLSIWGAAAILATSPAYAQVTTYHIRAGSLQSALDAWARQSRQQVIYRVDEIEGRKSRGAQGPISAEAALETLLAGTGFMSRSDPSGAVAIVKRAGGPTITAVAPRNSASSQEAADEASGSEETIVVTGSLIRRERSSQLVTEVDQKEIQLRGATNALDILAAVSQNQPIDTSTTTATFGGLANLANLRSLGSENTLVLFNGKRLVRNPLRDNGVDLNTIPVALIDSVDVLADGASSIYGTDAVAGVINFRTKEEIQGLNAYLHSLQPEARGGETIAGAFSFGAGSLKEKGWNFFAGGFWRERNSISSKDRRFANTSLIDSRGVNFLLRQPFPANLTQLDAAGNVLVNNANPYPCRPPETVPFRGGCGLDADAAGLIDIQNPEKQGSVVARASAMLGQQKASLEYLRARSSITSALTATTFFDELVPSTSPYFPGKGIVPAVAGLNPNLPILINTRFSPAGQRTTENLTTTDRMLAQLEGKAIGLDYELWGLRSSSVAKLKSLQGAVLLTAARDAFAGRNGAPFLNPFGEQTPEAARFLESIQVRDTLIRAEGTLSMAGLTVSDQRLFDLPGGQVAAAMAFEYAQEQVDYQRNPINSELEGAVVGGDQDSTGSRDRWSATAEILLPVLPQLEANASVRYDHYDDFGSTVNPKLLLRFRPAPFLELHASANTGFRAPTLYNLFTPNSLSFVRATLFNDPVLCPNGVVNTAAGGILVRDCSQLYNTLLGGNPDLNPEKSRAYSVGAILRVPQRLGLGRVTASLDYWNYEIKDRIGSLTPQTIFGDLAQFGSLLVRCGEADPALKQASTTCNFPAGGNPIAYISQTNTNLGKTRTAGFDVALTWGLDTGIGAFTLDYRGTYVTKFKFQRVPGQAFVSRLDQYVDGYPVLKYSHFATFTWASGPFAAQVQNRFKSGYEDCNGPCFIPQQFFNRVDAYSTWNLALTYDIGNTFSVTAHVTNLFDRDPPFSNGDQTLCTGCDTRFADPTGRAFGLTFRGSLERLFGRGTRADDQVSRY